MAISKQRPTEFGYDAWYHKIWSATLYFGHDLSGQAIDVTMVSWEDDAHRLAKHMNIGAQANIRIPLAEIDPTKDVRAEIYGWLIVTPKIDGADNPFYAGTMV